MSKKNLSTILRIAILGLIISFPIFANAYVIYNLTGKTIYVIAGQRWGFWHDHFIQQTLTSDGEAKQVNCHNTQPGCYGGDLYVYITSSYEDYHGINQRFLCRSKEFDYDKGRGGNYVLIYADGNTKCEIHQCDGSHKCNNITSKGI